MKKELNNLSEDAKVKIVDIFEGMSQSEFVDCSPEIVIDTEIESMVLDFAERLPTGNDISEKEMLAIEKTIKESVLDNISLDEIEESLEKSECYGDIMKSLGISEKDFL